MAGQETQLSTLEVVCRTIASETMQKQIAAALPPGVTVERFTRTALIALQHNPKAIDGCDKTSLYTALTEAASDGLLADGTEGALVAFNTNIGSKERPEWIKKIQWMPMIYGLRKRLGTQGITLDAQLVYKNDFFQQEFGDTPKVTHRPAQLGTDRGPIIGAYAIATWPLFNTNTFAGPPTKAYEVMSFADIEQVRMASRSPGSGPWVDWWGEMARKTVARRLIKNIPIMDEKVAQTARRDDNLYEYPVLPPEERKLQVQDMRPAGEASGQQHRPQSLQHVLDSAAKEQQQQKTTIASKEVVSQEVKPAAPSAEKPTRRPRREATAQAPQAQPAAGASQEQQKPMHPLDTRQPQEAARAAAIHTAQTEGPGEDLDDDIDDLDDDEGVV